MPEWALVAAVIVSLILMGVGGYFYGYYRGKYYFYSLYRKEKRGR